MGNLGEPVLLGPIPIQGAEEGWINSPAPLPRPGKAYSTPAPRSLQWDPAPAVHRNNLLSFSSLL